VLGAIHNGTKVCVRLTVNGNISIDFEWIALSLLVWRGLFVCDFSPQNENRGEGIHELGFDCDDLCFGLAVGIFASWVMTRVGIHVVVKLVFLYKSAL
jgi:hypothetical protein